MKNDPIRANVLAVKIIANVSEALAKSLKLAPGQRSIGLITCDMDDVGYTAVDEATKKAAVKVIYASSMYAGSANASTKLSGEFIGIIAGPDPEEVKSGLQAAMDTIENAAYFVSANDDDSIVFFAHCISRTGSYLSGINGLAEGCSLAYLIAPPLEAIYGLDMAMKAARVDLAAYYAPPSPTNFAGGLLTGSQSDCMAACEAFASAVIAVAENSIDLS